MTRPLPAPDVAPLPRFAVADSVVRFLSASAAAGNGATTVALKELCCPSCGELTLAFRALRRQAATSGKAHRREFQVVVRCRTGSCPFQGATVGRFALD